jgi:nitrogenase iron protein NifH
MIPNVKINKGQDHATASIMENEDLVIPTPMTMDELEAMVVKYGISD